MSKHILFICKSCHRSSEARSSDQPADGTQLLEQLNTLSTEQYSLNDLEIQSVSCLWICSQPCAVAFSALQKPTYLFTNLPISESADVLLQFGKLYLDSTTGDVPWKQFPEALQAVSIAKIPAWSEVGKRVTNE